MKFPDVSLHMHRSRVTLTDCESVSNQNYRVNDLTKRRDCDTGELKRVFGRIVGRRSTCSASELEVVVVVASCTSFGGAGADHGRNEDMAMIACSGPSLRPAGQHWRQMRRDFDRCIQTGGEKPRGRVE